MTDRLHRRMVARSPGADKTIRARSPDVCPFGQAQRNQASADSALEECRRDGGESAEAFFGSLAAEVKASYGPDRE